MASGRVLLISLRRALIFRSIQIFGRMNPKTPQTAALSAAIDMATPVAANRSNAPIARPPATTYRSPRNSPGPNPLGLPAWASLSAIFSCVLAGDLDPIRFDRLLMAGLSIRCENDSWSSCSSVEPGRSAKLVSRSAIASDGFLWPRSPRMMNVIASTPMAMTT